MDAPPPPTFKVKSPFYAAYWLPFSSHKKDGTETPAVVSQKKNTPIVSFDGLCHMAKLALLVFHSARKKQATPTFTDIFKRDAQ